MLNMKKRDSSYFADWIPCNIQTAICQEKMCGIEMCATSLFNTTAIREPLKVLYNDFVCMLKKKSHLEKYTEQGMDEMEFFEARDELFCLIAKYEEHQKASL